MPMTEINCQNTALVIEEDEQSKMENKLTFCGSFFLPHILMTIQSQRQMQF